jgi:flavin-dependent dehydrogenase
VKPADVVIVGAGPAGAATAVSLARAGLDVVLLDRCAFPRPKPCGDCLSPNVSRLLDRLGLLDAVLAERPARLQGWRIVSPHARSFETRFDEITDDPAITSALALRRDRLDAVLLEAARTAGAHVRTGIHVTGLLPDAAGVVCRTKTGEPLAVRARLTVGADGLRSVIAVRTGAVRRAARVRKLSLTTHVAGVAGDPVLGEMHLADGMCLGIAPVTDRSDLFNITLVADADRFGRVLARDADGFLRASIDRFPRARERFVGVTLPQSGEWLASGPFDRPVRPIVMPGIALVGDAAGYFDPFTGQGINQALEGAALLAEAAINALHDGPRRHPVLHSYAWRLRSRLRGPRAVQRMIDFILSRPRLADSMIARLGRRPVAARALIAATGDIAPAWSVAAPATLLALAGPPIREEAA